MTNKEKTIKAIEKIIEKYEKFTDNLNDYSNINTCALCKIYYTSKHVKPFCRGCILANEKSKQGCIRYNSFKRMQNILHKGYYDKKIFQNRANFFHKHLEYIKSLPTSQFTKRGWKYLDLKDVI